MTRRRSACRPSQLHLGPCPECGQIRYATKKRAKNAARDLHPGRTLRPYPCGGYWHFPPPEKVTERRNRPIRGARPTFVIVDEAVNFNVIERMNA